MVCYELQIEAGAVSSLPGCKDARDGTGFLSTGDGTPGGVAITRFLQQ
jgi:hypothetical protein